ncbi:hypothetical protein F2P56_020090 [Juglans regia]|uniref:Pentatricopeptide repeat-containing protein At1g77360, mitochondrial-like n=2 Tax=Juglans regia TaxID=51240 RepID=A0A6P9ES44_JUGRE|nr:pentatricopeptide repeat-containing protein At1g77360, mitochondrial-like [Juglans regia]KAF5460206.1 hypothetical protein F2P56_020090 [Juglans regia]
MEAMAVNPNTSSSSLSQIPTNSTSPLKPLLPIHQFPSHLDAPEISSAARTICEILTRVSPHDIESALSSTGISPSTEIVQEVLKFSYHYPSSAVKFFRWAGRAQKHSADAWNLMVDLLGKNQLFDPMWDAVRSMKEERMVSMATFESVFGSYCMVRRFNEAGMSFDVMDRYGIQADVLAVNLLLSVICREENQTVKALEFFDRIKVKIPPDGDTFAVLLEGWRKEGDVAQAKRTFEEMVIRLGWSPQYMSTYEAFLKMLLREAQFEEAIKFLQVMKENNCLPGLKFFSDALDILIELKDSSHAMPLWDIMVGSGSVPKLIMYNKMIGFLCNNNDIDNAFRLLDEMPFDGVFPDSLSYNMIFKCLIRNNKVHEVGKFFVEMIKNEWSPTHSNCATAITMLFEGYDPETAIEIWNYMIENNVKHLDESANALLLGLCNLGRLSETRRFADDMLDRRVSIYETTMAKLKNAFYKKEDRAARDKFDSLSRRWKGH